MKYFLEKSASTRLSDLEFNPTSVGFSANDYFDQAGFPSNPAKAKAEAEAEEEDTKKTGETMNINSFMKLSFAPVQPQAQVAGPAPVRAVPAPAPSPAPAPAPVQARAPVSAPAAQPRPIQASQVQPVAQPVVRPQPVAAPAAQPAPVAVQPAQPIAKKTANLADFMGITKEALTTMELHAKSQSGETKIPVPGHLSPMQAAAYKRMYIDTTNKDEGIRQRSRTGMRRILSAADKMKTNPPAAAAESKIASQAPRKSSPDFEYRKSKKKEEDRARMGAVGKVLNAWDKAKDSSRTTT
jgi:hypothetical protein